MTQEMCLFVHSIAGELSRPTDVSVLAQIALHADGGGEAVLTQQELAGYAGCSRDTVWRSLKRLNEGGWVSQDTSRVPGASSASVFRLSARITASQVSPRPSEETIEEASLQAAKREQLREVLPARGEGDGLEPSGFARLIRDSMRDGWTSDAGVQLAHLVQAQTPARLGWLAKATPGASFEDKCAELAQIAWDVIVDRSDYIATAGSPWGALASVVRTRLKSFYPNVEFADSEQIARSATMTVSGTKRVEVEHVSIRDVLAEENEGAAGLGLLVSLLVSEGVPSGLASSGTRRLAEIAASVRLSRAITMARADRTLATMGIDADAAGAWMSLIVGSRRGGIATSWVLRAQSGDLTLDDGDKARLAIITKHLTDTNAVNASLYGNKN